MNVIRRRRRRECIVTLKSGASFAGVLYDDDRRALVLRNARWLERGEDGASEAIPVDGELLVLCGDVAYVQMP